MIEPDFADSTSAFSVDHGLLILKKRCGRELMLESVQEVVEAVAVTVPLMSLQVAV